MNFSALITNFNSVVLPGLTNFTGLVNIKGVLTVTGIVIPSGGILITLGGLAISAGGIGVLLGGITVTAGGITVLLGGLTVTGLIFFTGATKITGDFTVVGSTSLKGAVTTAGNVTFDNDPTLPPGETVFTVNTRAVFDGSEFLFKKGGEFDGDFTVFQGKEVQFFGKDVRVQAEMFFQNGGFPQPDAQLVFLEGTTINMEDSSRFVINKGESFKSIDTPFHVEQTDPLGGFAFSCNVTCFFTNNIQMNDIEPDVFLLDVLMRAQFAKSVLVQGKFVVTDDANFFEKVNVVGKFVAEVGEFGGAVTMDSTLEVKQKLTAKVDVEIQGALSVAGLIEGFANMIVATTLQVGGVLTALSNVNILGTLEVTQKLTAQADVAVQGALSVAGLIEGLSNMIVATTLQVGGVLTALSNVNILGTLEVAQKLTAKGDVEVQGALTVTDLIEGLANMIVATTLQVGGVLTALSNVNIFGALDVVADSLFQNDLTVLGRLNLAAGPTDLSSFLVDDWQLAPISGYLVATVGVDGTVIVHMDGLFNPILAASKNTALPLTSGANLPIPATPGRLPPCVYARISTTPSIFEGFFAGTLNVTAAGDLVLTTPDNFPTNRQIEDACASLTYNRFI